MVVVVAAAAAAVAVEVEDNKTMTVQATANKAPIHLLTKHQQVVQGIRRTRTPNVSGCMINIGLTTCDTLTLFTDGGYQNYVALWYQSLMYQQQQQGGGQGPPAGAPAPGA